MVARQSKYMYEKAKIFTFNHPQLKKFLGVFFLVLGFVALITPLTPGATLLILLGCELLGLQFLFLERIKLGLRKRN